MHGSEGDGREGAPIGWGFVGASTWASRYIIPAVRAVPGARAIGISSSSPERGAAFAADNGLERAWASLEELLADPEVDAVYISTTNDLHAEQAIAAARAGKHVLCEKPLATSVADAERMIAECEAAGVVLATDHHQRGAPAIVAMRKQIEAGAIGEIVAARVSHANLLRPEFRGWRLDRPEAGAGAILDLTVHDADTIRFLLGDEVEEVTALSANQGLAAAGVEDSAMTVLRMRSGALVSLHDAFTVPFAWMGFEVHGTKASLIGTDTTSSEPVATVSIRDGDGSREVPIPETWPLYERVVERFLDAVAGRGRPQADGADGLASLRVALAATESAGEGRAVGL